MRHERQSARMRLTRTCFLLACIGLAAWSTRLTAQQPFDPLTASEIELARTVFLDDLRVKQNLAGNLRYRIVNIERHEENKTVAAGAQRRADVTLYSYTKDETISAIVRLNGRPQVDALEILSGVAPGLSLEEIEEATQLAFADPAVQMNLKAAGVSESEQESLIVTHLFARGIDKQDVCSTHRCVALFFNTQEASLFTAIVDLSAQRVQVP